MSARARTYVARVSVARGDEEHLYRDHHERLVRSVSWAVKADPALVEDACSRAWERLLSCQPERGERIFGWLRKVAIHEAWALSRRQLRERPVDADEWGEFGERRAEAQDVERALEARLALEALAGLRPRERRYLALRAAGYSYLEIASRCGVTYTNVNKHLTRGRARLRASAAPPEVYERERGAARRREEQRCNSPL